MVGGSDRNRYVGRYRENTIHMNETTVSAVDKSLAMLLKAEKDFPGYSLDFCSGYVSTDGVLPVKKMLKSSPKVRAVVGLNTSNRISAFQMLRDNCGVEVYVYVTRSYMLFHPKIYFGTLNAQAWAMVGSSNLTKSGLSSNIEHNLFMTGQRHTEPFISIETQIEAFCQQAYLFDTVMEVDNINVSSAKIRQMLKTSPFPRFERQGLLDISDDGKYFIINPALLVSLTPTVKEHLRKKAIERMRQHFVEDEKIIEAMIVQAIEATKP
ncbi:MAG: phospholipase D-like domain-containing protein [Ktedonobacteraceae bacterium]